MARELGRLTGLPVFDNHLSYDCGRAVFGHSPSTQAVVEQIRHAVIGEAARQGISLIFTFVYFFPDDTVYVERICDLVEGQGGSVDFVQLTCDVSVREERVVAPHRVGRKLDTVEWLRTWSQGRELSRPIPGRDGLHIDNTRLSVGETALRIAQDLGLSLG